MVLIPNMYVSLAIWFRVQLYHMRLVFYALLGVWLRLVYFHPLSLGRLKQMCNPHLASSLSAA